jgi:hypothetical protein
MITAHQKTGKDPLDRYYTPEWPTRLLLDHWPWPEVHTVWEPCAGMGHIVRVLEERFGVLGVLASDIDPDSPYPRRDFMGAMAPEAQAIVTNPPYTTPDYTAADFVRRALEITPRVAMLLRLSWLEPCGDRAGIFATSPPSEVWILPRVDFDGPNVGGANSNGATSAWFIWGTGEGTVVRWFSASDREQYSGQGRLL